MTDADSMTTTLVAALVFSGNLGVHRHCLHRYHSMPQMECTSHCHQRLRRSVLLVVTFGTLVGEHWNVRNAVSISVIDNVPFPAVIRCASHVRRSIRGDAYSDDHTGKQRDIYRITTHRMVTYDGQPVASVLPQGSSSAPAGLADGTLDLPAGAWVIGDNADTQDDSDEVLAEVGICVLSVRTNNVKHPVPLCLCSMQSSYCKAVVLFILSVSFRGLLTS